MALGTDRDSRQKNITKNLRQRLALSTALASLAFVGYGTRGAYAGSCPGAGGTYTCSGAVGADVTQLLIGFPLNVTTSSGFGINTAAGNALTLISTDGLTFTDTHSSVITGAEIGIDAYNYDSNALNISVTGAVTGIAGSGIYTFSYYGGGATQITAATVTGGTHGIEANHSGSAGLTVSVSGDVTGNGGDGIRAFNSADVATGSMLIEQDVGTTTYGAVNGINADNADGSLTINALGTSSGGTGAGIYAVNQETATDLTITANNADGGAFGIDALNSGSGALSVTATGEVTGGNGDGIRARNGVFEDIFGYFSFATANTGTDLTVLSEAAVSGGRYGIFAYNTGTGALSITANGSVSGAGFYDGIYAYNSSNGTSLTVVTNDEVIGGGDGIRAVNIGSGAGEVGALSITTTGTVTGNTDEGIDAYNSYRGGDLTIVANGEVSANSFGIRALNEGTGVLSVTATADVSSTNADGIRAVNGYYSGYGTGLTVSAAAVAGDQYGIVAGNFGGGNLSVTASGPVTGTNDDGIYAYNYSSGENLTVQTEALVSGGNGGDGIEAVNLGTGLLQITANAHVQGDDDGIEADNEGTDLTISAVSVTGGEDGIDADNRGATGVLDISVSGAIEGGTGHSIRTETDAGDATVIALNSGASVSATSGIAISNNEGDSDTTVNTGASVTGEIQLGDGSDNLTFDGGDFSTVSKFDGGDNASSADGSIDKLTFRNVTGALDGSTAVNWENMTVDANGVISLSNTLTAESVTVAAGGTLGGTGTVDGNLTIEAGGTLGPGNSAGDFTVDGDLRVEAGGGLEFEVFSVADFDTLTVLGEVTFDPGAEIDLLFDIDPGNLFDGLTVTFLSAEELFGFDERLFNFIGLDPFFTASVGFDDVNDDLFLTLNRTGGTTPGGTAVPEPGTLALFGAGLLGLVGLGWRRRRYAA